MSNIWFTSDLHLGHKMAAELRGFSSVEEHNGTIISNLNKVVGSRDKLFVLGDVAWSEPALKMLEEVNCKNMELIFGNHDNYQPPKYLRYFSKVHGFRRYDNLWLSHCPIHPQEMYRCLGNLHGHIHKGAGTPELAMPYYNVNMDFHAMNPVNYDNIKLAFEDYRND